jgi:hypothetical protein
MPVYEHVVANLGDYLDALPGLEPPGTPIQNPEVFSAVLNDIKTTTEDGVVERLVEATSVGCRVADLGEVDTVWWPCLVRHRRTEASFMNVKRYIGEYNVDADLGAFLIDRKGVSSVPEDAPQSERLAVASALLSAAPQISEPTTRVALAKSLDPGTVAIGAIAAKHANLVGPMLAAGLLEDSPETYDPVLLARWGDFEAAVAASNGFGTFADTVTMPVHFLAATLKSRAIPEHTKKALVARLGSLLANASQEDATEIASELAQRTDALDLPRIQALTAAKASTPSLVRLLATQQAHLQVSELRAALTDLPGDYARLGQGGRGTVRFEVTQEHASLLSRLAGVTHTGARRINTLRYGMNLEANLKRPTAAGRLSQSQWGSS